MTDNTIENDRILSSDVVSSVKEWSSDLSGDSGFSETVKTFNSSIKFKVLFILASVAIIIIATSYAVTVGALSIGFLEVYELSLIHI